MTVATVDGQLEAARTVAGGTTPPSETTPPDRIANALADAIRRGLTRAPTYLVTRANENRICGTIKAQQSLQKVIF